MNIKIALFLFDINMRSPKNRTSFDLGLRVNNLNVDPAKDF